MRIIVTGASGFVGSGLVQRLTRDTQHAVVAAYRKLPSIPVADADLVRFDLSDGAATLGKMLEGIDAVVHLAARVHVMRDAAADPLAEFRRANVRSTLELARQAALAGVQRFVYVSSIKVNGEATLAGRPFRADDAPDPHDPYGVSKAEAEQGLWALAAQTGLPCVVVRPPLVYGPGVKANFRSMMGWLARGVPLPFGAIHNRRSLVSRDNLCDLLATCVSHPGAPGHTFLASDGEDVSSTQLLRRLGQALGRPARLLPLPPPLLSVMLTALGKGDVAQRLFSSLQVDSSDAQRLLGWRAPLSLDEGLRQAALAFLAEARSR